MAGCALSDITLSLTAINITLGYDRHKSTSTEAITTFHSPETLLRNLDVALSVRRSLNKNYLAVPQIEVPFFLVLSSHI